MKEADCLWSNYPGKNSVFAVEPGLPGNLIGAVEDEIGTQFVGQLGGSAQDSIGVALGKEGSKCLQKWQEPDDQPFYLRRSSAFRYAASFSRLSTATTNTTTS